MKLRFFSFAFATAFAALSSSSAGISIAINPTASAAGTTGVGAFVFEVLESQLSEKGDYDLVDRKRLSDLLSEQSLAAGGITQDQAANVGKLVGAKYFIFGESKQSGEKTAIQCRVVQVETGVLKPVLLIVPNEEDPIKAGDDLATQVNAAIAKLEGRAVAEIVTNESLKKLDVPADAKRPSIAFRIPEISVTPQTGNADPAAEKTLESFLQANGSKLIQLSRPSQAIAAATGLPTIGSTGAHLEGKEHEKLLAEAKAKGVEVIILGVATSERATQIGNFIAARARVELAAIRVSDSQILATTSGYGVATDLSNFVAEKKAIESATAKVQTGFAKEIITAFNAPQ